MREAVHKRARTPEFKMLPFNEGKRACWEELLKICPKYEGYDIAISFNGQSIDLGLVVENTDAKQKLAFLHYDMKMYSDHWDEDRKLAMYFYDYWRQMDNLVVLTEQNKISFDGMFPNLSAKTIVLPNISMTVMMKQEAERYYPTEFENAAFRIFTSARIVYQKGIDLILEACRLLNVRSLDYRWVVIGGSNSKFGDDLMLEYDRSDLKDRLIMKGCVNNPFPYYKHCDLYVQPSRYEGRCLALEEARIMDCTILATNYPSVADVITDGMTGVICNLSAQSIADCIIKMVEDKPLRERLSKANDKYTGDEGIEKYIELMG